MPSKKLALLLLLLGGLATILISWSVEQLETARFERSRQEERQRWNEKYKGIFPDEPDFGYRYNTKDFGFPLPFFHTRNEILEKSNSLTDIRFCLTGNISKWDSYPRNSYRPVVCIQRVTKSIAMFFLDTVIWVLVILIIVHGGRKLKEGITNARRQKNDVLP